MHILYHELWKHAVCFRVCLLYANWCEILEINIRVKERGVSVRTVSAETAGPNSMKTIIFMTQTKCRSVVHNYMMHRTSS